MNAISSISHITAINPTLLGELRAPLPFIAIGFNLYFIGISACADESSVLGHIHSRLVTARENSKACGAQTHTSMI